MGGEKRKNVYNSINMRKISTTFLFALIALILLYLAYLRLFVYSSEGEACGELKKCLPNLRCKSIYRDTPGICEKKDERVPYTRWLPFFTITDPSRAEIGWLDTCRDNCKGYLIKYRCKKPDTDITDPIYEVRKFKKCLHICIGKHWSTCEGDSY